MHSVPFIKRLCLLLSLVVGFADQNARAASQTPESAVAYYGYSVIKVYPHDPEAFTEGLFYSQGTLYESTGLNGKSSVRQVQLETGKVLRKVAIDSKYFGEGIAPWKGRVFGLTWQTQQGFVWGQKDFGLKHHFNYKGEGWGLTHNSDGLIMSDGTSTLKFINPDGFKIMRTINVTLRGQPVDNLNELEWINGEIFANIWQTDFMVRINPADGKVTGVIDLGGLMANGAPITRKIDVLNGIAFDPATQRLFVTGKFWPSLFEIKLIKTTDPTKQFSF